MPDRAWKARRDGVEDGAVWLGDILGVVRDRRGIDFNGYRQATLLRRVRNRMIAANVRTLPEYWHRLRSDPSEADALIERLTIKVSRFFRDADTFAVLARELAALQHRCPTRSPQLWSAGCGYGEEAYSLAILLSELGGFTSSDVLATDIDPSALARARKGSYSVSAIEELPDELRSRYFDECPAPTGAAYCVRPKVRMRVDLCLHDLVGSTDSPHGRQFDLICCRNVLIYLQRPLQEHVERLLARSLLPGGLLCLGEAEWLSPGVASCFDVVDGKAHLFRLSSEASCGVSP